MNLVRNILANYASQIYVTAIGIVMVPLYLIYMGAEAYGLVGFFAVLQAWFNLLDVGMTPTVARESARFRGGATTAINYRRFLRALEGIFVVVALAGAGALLVASSYIATDWLRVERLPFAEVRDAVQLMAVSIGLRWLSGLYRGTISGSERLVWLGTANALFATLRFVGVLPVFVFVGTTPTVFFGYQLLVAALELVALGVKAHKDFPTIPAGTRLPWSWTPLKPALKFSLTIAFTSSVWVLVTGTDKLLLSRMLPLEDYGYFTLAVLVAGGVAVISGPVSAAILPRMAVLEAQGDQGQLRRVYRQATQLVAVIAGSTTATLVLCAEPLLWAWTGDRALAKVASPILVLYALGNGLLAVSAFPYYLQYAKGDLHLHLIGNVAFVLVLIPAIIWSAGAYGGIGAGWVWMVMNLIYFVVWVPVVHNRLSPGLNARWYVQDVLAIFLSISVVGLVSLGVVPQSASRWLQAGAVMALWLLLMMAGAGASITLWSIAKARLARKAGVQGPVQ